MSETAEFAAQIDENGRFVHLKFVPWLCKTPNAIALDDVDRGLGRAARPLGKICADEQSLLFQDETGLESFRQMKRKNSMQWPGRSLLLSLVIASAASTAIANKPAPFVMQSGSWAVHVDPSLGNGCFFLRGFRDGSALRVGLDLIHHVGYIDLGNGLWKSLKVGESYRIQVSFDHHSPVTWRAKGLRLGSTVFLSMRFRDPKIWDVIAKASSSKFYYRGQLLTSLPLKGIAAAVSALEVCQRKYPAKATDPFANSKG